jgi:2-dehydro-3-deoxygluconokinase
MYVSCVPDHLVGRHVVQYLAQQGIDVSHMLYGGDRLGLYFLPQGTDLKNAGVIYDRAYSAFSQLKPGTIDWDSMLHGVSWLHFSAITPALNQNLAAISKEAAAAAAQKGIPVSLDLNYRARLWNWGRAPIEIMPDLIPFCDVLMGNLWAFEKMLSCNINEEKLKTATKDEYLEEAQHLSKNLVYRFPKLKAVANTFRFDRQPGEVQYYATLFGSDQFYVSSEYTVAVVDKVGSGDCFMAGLIYGFYNNISFAQMLNFATAAAVTKLREIGDATHSTAAAIQESIKDYER